MNNQLTITNDVFWKAGLSISSNGKYPTQQEIEEYFNFRVIGCWNNESTLAFRYDPDATAFLLKWS